MDVGSSSSMSSAVSVDRYRRAARRRHRQSVRQTSTDRVTETAAVPEAAGTRTADCTADFDNLLHDRVGYATFSVSSLDDSITLRLYPACKLACV